MGKAELFAGATGVIGLFADVITIIDWIHNHSSHTESHTSSITLFIFLLVYGWFILSWLIVRWYYSRRKLNTGKPRTLTLSELSDRAVTMLGVFLLPLAAYLASSIGAEIPLLNSVEGTFYSVCGAGGIMFFVGLFISTALKQGMPLIYDDIDDS